MDSIFSLWFLFLTLSLLLICFLHSVFCLIFKFYFLNVLKILDGYLVKYFSVFVDFLELLLTAGN